MQRQLTTSEIINYTVQMMEFYREAKFSEQLVQKLIAADIEYFNNQLKWIDKLEQKPSLDTLFEYSSYLLKKLSSISKEFKQLGGTDKQFEQFQLLASSEKFQNIDLKKKMKELINRATENIINLASLISVNADSLIKHTEEVDSVFESKSDKTKEEKDLLSRNKTLQVSLKDEKSFVTSYLNMTPEQRAAYEKEAIVKVTSSLDELKTTLDSKLRFFSDSSKNESADSKDLMKIPAELQKILDQHPNLKNLVNQDSALLICAVALQKLYSDADILEDCKNGTDVLPLNEFKNKIDAELKEINVVEVGDGLSDTFLMELGDVNEKYLQNTQLGVTKACEALVPIKVAFMQEASKKLETIIKDKQSKTVAAQDHYDSVQTEVKSATSSSVEREPGEPEGQLTEIEGEPGQSKEFSQRGMRI